MKNTISRGILAFSTLFVSLSFSACFSPSEEVQNADRKVNEAQAELQAAEQDYAEEVAQYKKSTRARMAVNEEMIADLKAQIDEQKDESKNKYQELVSELEERNNKLQNRLKNYKAISKDNWQSFKDEFNHDMEDLGTALTNFGVDNKD